MNQLLISQSQVWKRCVLIQLIWLFQQMPDCTQTKIYLCLTLYDILNEDFERCFERLCLHQNI